MHDKTLELPQYFYLLMGKRLGHYFQVRPAYYQAAQCNQKTPILVSSRWQRRSEKAKKGKASTLITATTGVHLPKSVSTDLTKNSDSVLTIQIGKDGVRGWLMMQTYLFQPTLIETSFSIWPQLLSQGILSLFYLPSSKMEERHTTLGKIWFHLINQTSIS